MAAKRTGAVYAYEVKDDAGRVVNYFVQTDPTGISCWTHDAYAGRLTPQELFSACVRAEASR